MSEDLKLKQKCPHQVVEEWLQIESDRRTIRPIRPPSSTRVSLLKNRVPAPPNGVYSEVSITGKITQPFEIETGDNDTVLLEVNGGALQTVTLPVGTNVRASDIVEAFTNQASGIIVQSVQGRIKITLERQGSTASLRFMNGNGHVTLGFPPQRHFNSRTIIPAWDLVRDPRSEDPQARLIRFREALRSHDDIFEVTYTTRQGVCRRCMGLGVENDLRHGKDGQPIFTNIESLMLQEVEKILFTVRGSHAFHSWYGSSLSTLIGSKISAGGQYTETQLIAEISNTLERYRTVKEQQSHFQPVTKREMLEQVVSVNVEQDARDPTVFRIAIELRSRSGEINIVEDTIVLSQTSFAEGFQRFN